MTDRPRVWTTTTPDDPVEWVPSIEWDREKVEAAMVGVISRELSHEITSPAALARAIFDALDREQT